MRKFQSPYGTLVLTAERMRHILKFHPDTRTCVRYFASTLKEPELAVSSVRDPEAVICYRYLAQQKRYLAIVVHINKRFVITAYLAKRTKSR